MTLEPTPQLRWIDRAHNGEIAARYPDGRPASFWVKRERVLQQWWNDTGPNGGPDVGVWRDVPLEAE